MLFPLVFDWRRVGFARNVLHCQVILFLTFWLGRNTISWAFFSPFVPASGSRLEASAVAYSGHIGSKRETENSPPCHP